MPARIWISNLQFSDDSTISIEKNGIVLFVGANNVGKSATLKEIMNLFKSKANPKKVLQDIAIQTEGSKEEIHSFIESIAEKDANSSEYRGFNFSLTKAVIDSRWLSYQNGIKELSPVFIQLATTEQRLRTANPPESIRIISYPPQHPIHFLQKNDTLEKRFSDYFRQAFGMDLIVHRNAGKEVPLYIGNRPTPKDGEDRVSEGYLRELEKLELLHTQGDGMRSFVGVLLETLISHHSILLIDEPEAFLHPPQARLLGQMLAKNLPANKQLFLTTHSEDFLQGLLDANTNNLTIIRIQREESINRVSVLNNTDIRDIWKDSLLRHSNILKGLFHPKVIICESDSDCRFFSAILSAIYEDNNSVNPDLLFVHCGGKHRIPVVVKALRNLGVPLKVVTDFDVLNDINPLKEIFEALGGVWNDVENDWKLVKESIDARRPELETERLKEGINTILQSTDERIFPKQKISEIQRLLKKASAWAYAKETGKAFIPSGDATQAFERIQHKFTEKNLLILEIGELEGFDKSIGNHGPKWVNEVLAKDIKSAPELQPAREFVARLVT